jgi:hypothetical protein
MAMIMIKCLLTAHPISTGKQIDTDADFRCAARSSFACPGAGTKFVASRGLDDNSWRQP